MSTSSRGSQRAGKSKPTNRGGGKPKRTNTTTRTGRAIEPSTSKRKPSGPPMPKFSEEVRLNKYLSNAGICSRREADVLIETGVVTVNGEIISELGYKVKPGDVVKYDGERINTEKKRYVLLNKPKDFVTRMDDPLARKNVMGLVIKACKERIFPLDKMDREATGLLLFTNDSDLTKKLTHPKLPLTRIYHITTDKPFQAEHLEKMVSGVHMDDEMMRVTQASYVDGKTSREIGIEVRNIRTKIIERMVERLGYSIIKIDRVQYGSLTKKDLPRGHYRHLTEQEVAFLKMS
jgi:23S rRNA pseudouridine2605 synthase